MSSKATAAPKAAKLTFAVDPKIEAQAQGLLKRFPNNYAAWVGEVEGATFVKAEVATSKAGKEYARAVLQDKSGNPVFAGLNALKKAIDEISAIHFQSCAFSKPEGLGEGVEWTAELR